MRSQYQAAWVILLALSLLIMELSGCRVLKSSSTAKLRADPEEIVITKALLKNPVQFRGWGYVPEEHIAVNLVIPKGVKIKKAPADEDSVRIAYAIADEYGNFKATMGARETLDWIFQVGWDNNSKPVFKDATPLPPGKYEIRAIGQDSQLSGVTILTVRPPDEEK